MALLNVMEQLLGMTGCGGMSENINGVEHNVLHVLGMIRNVCN